MKKSKAKIKKVMNNKQKLFAESYARSNNATQSAIQAGYSEKTAYSQGNRLLKKVEILNYVRSLQQETLNEFGISRKWFTAQYLKVISESIKSGKLGVMRQALDSLSDRLKIYAPDQLVASDWVMDEADLRQKVAQLLYIVASSPNANMHERIRAVELMGKSLGLFEKIDNQILEPLPWQD